MAKQLTGKDAEVVFSKYTSGVSATMRMRQIIAANPAKPIGEIIAQCRAEGIRNPESTIRTIVTDALATIAAVKQAGRWIDNPAPAKAAKPKADKPAKPAKAAADVAPDAGESASA